MRLSLSVGLLGAAVFLVCSILWIDEPFDAGNSGRIGGMFAYSARAFHELGPLNVKCSPCGWFHPSSPDSLVTYTHHPCLTHLVTWMSFEAFGNNERALRIPVILAVVIAILVFAKTMTSLGDGRRGAMAALLLATMPVVIHYGSMVDVEPLLLLNWVVLAAAWQRFRATPTCKTRWCFFAAAFFAPLIDWIGLGITPFIALDIALDRRGFRDVVKRTAIAACPFLAAVLLHISWVSWVEGGPREAVRNLYTLLEICGGTDAAFPDAPIELNYLSAMQEHTTSVIGVALALFALAGIGIVVVRLVLQTADAFDRATLMLFGGGVLCVTVVWKRAIELDSMLLPMAPGIAAAAACTLASISSRISERLPKSSRLVAIGIGCMAVAFAWFGTLRGIDRHAGDRSTLGIDVAKDLDAVLGETDTLILLQTIGPAIYYTRASVIHGIARPEFLHEVLPRLAAARGGIGRLFIWSFGEVDPEKVKFVLTLPRPIGAQPKIIKVAGRDLAIVELDCDAVVARKGS